MRFVLAEDGWVESIFTPTTPLGDHIIEEVKDRLRDEAANITKEIVLGILSGLRDIFIDSSYAIALVGGGLLIIFQVAGYKNGFRYAGILFVANVMIKYLLGG